MIILKAIFLIFFASSFISHNLADTVSVLLKLVTHCVPEDLNIHTNWLNFNQFFLKFFVHLFFNLRLKLI